MTPSRGNLLFSCCRQCICHLRFQPFSSSVSLQGTRPQHPNKHPNDHGRRLTRKPRDMSKRNFEGERLAAKLKEREEAAKIYEPYERALRETIDRYKKDVEAEEQRMFDVEGVYMKQQEAMREEQMEKMKMFAKSAEKLKILREQKVCEAEEAMTQAEKLKAERVKKKDEERFRFNTELVLRAIEESKDFVTPENLEEKIAYALDNEKNYNFALEPDGTKIQSSEPPGNFGGKADTPGPQAFALGGILPGSPAWNLVFKDRVFTLEEKRKQLDEVK